MIIECVSSSCQWQRLYDKDNDDDDNNNDKKNVFNNTSSPRQC